MTTSDRQMLLKALLRRIEGSRGKLPGERELALAVGASRPSLREALGVLEALRLIERRPQSGIYVLRAAADASIEALVLCELLDMRPPAATYEQAQEARVIHEIEAVRLAAARRTATDIATMRALLDTARANHAAGHNLADDDEAFHLALVASARNPILLRLTKSLYLMTHSVRQAYFAMAGNAAPSIAEHDRLLASVEKRDAERAVALMKQHYAGSSARWRRAAREAA
jgi:DNA-binding FadR family transcriptional regulator